MHWACERFEVQGFGERLLRRRSAADAVCSRDLWDVPLNEGKICKGEDGMPLGGSFGGRVAVGLNMRWCGLGSSNQQTLCQDN
jgi:hypothetical protein